MLQQASYSPLADDPIAAIPDRRQQIEINSSMMGVESLGIIAAIDRLEETILNSPRLPLTGKTMVKEDEILEQLDIIRLNLPEIVATAQEILQYKQQIVAEAHRQAQQTITEAELKANRITNELGIIDRSEQEARKIRQIAFTETEYLKQQTLIEVAQTRDRSLQDLQLMRQEIIAECQQIQFGADEYADRVLHNMEYQLTDILQAIQRGRQRLSHDAETFHKVRSIEPELPSLGDRLKEISESTVTTAT
jgi:dsDNA-specific endonuclease/ATPase MutS2